MSVKSLILLCVYFALALGKRKKTFQHNIIYRSTTLNIPFDLLNVQFIVPTVEASKKKTLHFKNAVNAFRAQIITLNQKMKKYNESLTLTRLHLETLGYRQLSIDLLANNNKIQTKIDNMWNIFDRLAVNSDKNFSMIPIAGDKTSLIRKAIERTVESKRSELSKSVYKKKKLIHAILRIAAHTKPLIIDKQPEMSELVDLYDIWNDSASSLKFR
jgi:hypothetical protein